METVDYKSLYAYNFFCEVIFSGEDTQDSFPGEVQARHTWEQDAEFFKQGNGAMLFFFKKNTDEFIRLDNRIEIGT